MGVLGRFTERRFGLGTLICLVFTVAFTISISYKWLLTKRNTDEVVQILHIGDLTELGEQTENVSIVSSSPLSCDEYICEFQGVCGPLSSDDAENGIPRVTMIAMPRPISRNPLTGEVSSGSMQQLIVFRAWVHLDNVQVVVLTQHCQTLKAARQLGLTTLSMSSGSEVRDLTYRNALSLIEKNAKTSLVGFCNSDIIFNKTLTETLWGIMKASKVQKAWERFMITGRRRNYDVPAIYSEALGDTDNFTALDFRERIDDAWFAVRDYLHGENGSLFIDGSQDYWVWRRPLGISWFRDVPPYLIGGVQFDNWLSSYVNWMSRVRVIDTTATVNAYHLNHAKGGVFAAHLNDASSLNVLVGRTTRIMDTRTSRLKFYSTVDPYTNTFRLVKRNASELT